ncbi:MAG: phytoene desaturase family protein, partial [Candidatus Sericytochromatia bacterium]
MNEYNFDVIVIGSGIGGLAVASLLAQFQNQRVLVLERHFKAGGFTHVFQRKKYTWDVGIHYIGEMAEGQLMRSLFDLVTQEGVRWNKMPDPFEKFVYPDFSFELCSGKEAFISGLAQHFPQEEKAIRQYVHDVRQMGKWFKRFVAMQASRGVLSSFFEWLSSRGAELARISTEAYLQQHFQDPRLRAVLISQWGDYGLPPSLSSFAIHALVVGHYLYGGYYPIGGSATIANSILPLIEAAGGEVRLLHEVQEICVEKNQAIGVKVRDLRKKEPTYLQFYAPVIISDTGAYSTYLKLIPQRIEIPFRQDLQDFCSRYPATSNVSLYLGFKTDPRTLGFRGENHWMYSSYDHEAHFQARNTWLLEGTEPPGAYLSFASLKDPEAQSHTGEIIAFADYEYFAGWKDAPWKRRGEDYEAFKARIAQSLLDFVEQRYPGFKDLVDYAELSTPVTNEFFTGHSRGMIYGLPCVPERFVPHKSPWCQVATPIKGLYLTGADTLSPGIGGALAAGLATACK